MAKQICELGEIATPPSEPSWLFDLGQEPVSLFFLSARKLAS
jgi:hypothetical protein